LKSVVQDVESAVSLGNCVRQLKAVSLLNLEMREDYLGTVHNDPKSFMGHDVFTENPVKGANADYMRAIIHGRFRLCPCWK